MREVADEVLAHVLCEILAADGFAVFPPLKRLIIGEPLEEELGPLSRMSPQPFCTADPTIRKDQFLRVEAELFAKGWQVLKERFVSAEKPRSARKRPVLLLAFMNHVRVNCL